MKRLFRIFFIPTLIGVFGCTSADSDKGRFDRIAETLDKGGSSYFISSSRHAGTAFSDFIKKSEDSLWLSSLPSESKFRLQHFISLSELVGRVAGLHEIKGWGGSSRQLPGKGVLFRNKFRLLLPGKPQGILWSIFPGSDHNLENYLYNLPQDTFFAGAVELSPRFLKSFLQANKKMADTANSLCKVFLNMTPEEALDSLSGVWRFVVVCDEKNNTETLEGIHTELTLPDPGGKIFKALSERLKILPNSRVDLHSGTIRLEKIGGKFCIPYICRGQETLSIYTTPGAYSRINTLESFPQLLAFIKRLSRFTSLKGTGVFYCRNAGPGKDFSRSVVMDSVKPSLAVLKKLPDGFILENIAACDFNQYAVYSLLSLPMEFLPAFLTEVPRAPRSQAAKAAPAKKAAAPARQAAAPGGRRSCTGALQFAGQKIVQDAVRSGKWAAPGIAGLRTLVNRKVLTAAMLKCPSIKGVATSRTAGLSYANCHYLYFGKPGKNSPKTPVLMEFPFLHKKHFSVFYADGKVEKIQLDGRRNVRRAVSFLHTTHSYDEEEFMRLMQLASEFDKILER